MLGEWMWLMSSGKGETGNGDGGGGRRGDSDGGSRGDDSHISKARVLEQLETGKERLERDGASQQARKLTSCIEL